MKKISTSFIFFTAILVIAGFMASCQSSTNKQKAATGQTDNSNAGQATVPAGGDPANAAQATQQQDPKTLVVHSDGGNSTIKMMASNPGGAPGPVAKPITDPEQQKARELYLSGAKKSQEGDQKGAIADLTESLNHHKIAGTYLKRGYAELLDQQYQNVINDMNEALRMAPGLERAYFARGVSKFELQDFAGAEEDLKRFTSNDKTTAMAFNYLAGCRFMAKDFKGALENYEMVVKIDPKYPDIYTNRGMMKHYMNDVKGALEDYNKAITADPENATAYNNRGAAKLNLKDAKGALDDFNKAISIKQDYADAYDNRGKAKHNLGDTEGACEDWQRAYSLGLEASRELIIKFCK